MKQFRLFGFLAFVFLFLTACEESFDPEEENNGTEYFEFKINEEEFVGVGIEGECAELTFNYFPEPVLDLPAGYMTLGAKNCEDNSSVMLTFQGVEAEATGTTSLEFLSFASSFEPYARSVDGKVFNRLLDGTFRIEEFTGRKKQTSGIFSGTFEMRLTDFEKTDTLYITDGRYRFFVSDKLD